MLEEPNQREEKELGTMADVTQGSRQYYRTDGEEGQPLPMMSANGNNSLSSYKINYDPEPQIVRKQASCPVVYKQEVAVRYLKPPTPPPPGPLIIKEVRASQPPPAPPVIIRQRPPRPATPPPMVIREQPPQPPQPLGPKVITRNLPPPPPPPRRVIIERLPPLPPKPRSIIVERWLPYKQLKRRVVYQRAPQLQHPQPQKNLIIQWEGAQVKVQKEFRNLGIARADPNMYVQQYGPQLKHPSALPDFAKAIGPPQMQQNESDQPMTGYPDISQGFPDPNSGVPPHYMIPMMDCNEMHGFAGGSHMIPELDSSMVYPHELQHGMDDSRSSMPMMDNFGNMLGQDVAQFVAPHDVMGANVYSGYSMQSPVLGQHIEQFHHHHQQGPAGFDDPTDPSAMMASSHAGVVT